MKYNYDLKKYPKKTSSNDILHKNLPPREKGQDEGVQTDIIPIMRIDSVLKSFMINNRIDFDQKLKSHNLNQHYILVNLSAFIVVKNTQIKAVIFIFYKNESRMTLTITACDTKVWDK
jgi:hypothetical protein